MYKQGGNGIVIIAIVLILITGLGIINFAGVELTYLSWAEQGIYSVLSPVFRVFSGLYNSVSSYWKGLTDLKNVISEKEQLEKKVSNLERKIKECESIKRENERLRDLLAFKEFVSYETEGAAVIGYGPSNWKNKILIDKGRQDGLKEKMPVISYNGMLVGRIDYVGPGSSQVQLLNDPEFVVAGIVQREESRAVGLVKGLVDEGKYNVMKKIGWDEDIKEDDIVLTSGLSDNYPKGIPIGKVVKVESDNYGVSQKAKIEIFMERRTIEEVLVITEF